MNPQLYSLPNASGAFYDIKVGNNRVSFQQFNNVGYDAGPGWDAASGLGSPDGTALSGVLKVRASATVAPSTTAKVRTVKPAAGPKVSDLWFRRHPSMYPSGELGNGSKASLL